MAMTRPINQHPSISKLIDILIGMDARCRRAIELLFERSEGETMEAVTTLTTGTRLISVLRRMVEVRSGLEGVMQAFGAPGDWGYATPLGEVLYEISRSEAGPTPAQFSLDPAKPPPHWIEGEQGYYPPEYPGPLIHGEQTLEAAHEIYADASRPAVLFLAERIVADLKVRAESFSRRGDTMTAALLLEMAEEYMQAARGESVRLLGDPS